MSTSPELEQFLSECAASGDAAYAALKGVLERLEAPGTRASTRVFLAEVHRRFAGDGEECFRKYHFRIHDVSVAEFEGYQKRKSLIMMEIPSIFIPEDWSFTFFEGINRHPDSMYRERTVAELGCGNGWISIALAAKWCPLKVYGLDINPRAIKISWINLFLNALDENGQLIYDVEGKTLLDRVEFHESDLLAYCRDNKIELERIVGCIPQILNPNPEAMSKIATENSSEEFLYSLSNYCALQGFIEDQFGLGLIARAVEEGIAVIKPTGIMVFNMGGRPGQAVCRRLFERRGFCITKLWQTKIMQAADTDISALVEIEKNSQHRFEFFMGLVGDQPICARTASAYMKSGGSISHALSVYSCQMRQPIQVKKIFEFLKDGFQEVGSSLDLSFEDDAVADEKIPFLAYLASFLKEHNFSPYEPPAGCSNFRNLVAGFMRSYHHIPLCADNVIVFPSRAVAIEDALRLFLPRLAIVDEQLTRHLPREWLTSLAIEGCEDDERTECSVTVIEAPRQSDLLIELIRKLKPQVVVAGMAQFEAITSSAFENLLTVTKDVGSRLFLDISEHLELSSLPSTNGVLKYLAGRTLPSHAAIMCGLVKNKVYSDLEVAFVISEDSLICQALGKTVELMEGHTAVFSQHYYGCLFHELLAFQIAERHPLLERVPADVGNKMIGFSTAATSTLDQAELFIAGGKESAVIHMDLDHSFLTVPSVVKASIFESFARQNMAESETDLRAGILELVKNRYGFSQDSALDIVHGNSCLALFNKLVLCCNQEKGTLIFPSGTNGHYTSAAKFMKVDIIVIPTHPDTGFKIVPSALEDLLGTVSRPWLYISGPITNPSGSLYDDAQIQELLAVCAKFGARVIIDTSFSGLEFETSGSAVWNLQRCLSIIQSPQASFCVSLLGGLSLELLSELEFGYLILTDQSLVDAFYSFPSLSRPHRTQKYAIKKLLSLKNKNAQAIREADAEQRQTLKARADTLAKVLTSCGWDTVGCCGGISMVAKPMAYIGKFLKVDGFEGQLEDSNIREAVLKATGLTINTGSWTGIPGYCRLSFALDDSEFEQALDRLSQFGKLVLGS